MSEITMKGNQPIPTKKKKHSGLKVFLIVFFSIILGIPILLIGLVFAFFFDSTHKDVLVRSNYTTQQVFNEIVTNSLNYTSSEHKVRVRINENNLNQILTNAISGLSSSNGVIRNLYCDVYNGTYSFVMEINAANFFKTRVVLNCAAVIDDVNISFQITDVMVGRIHKMQGLFNFIRQFVQIPDLSSALSGSGINLKVDLDNLRLVYAIEDFHKDVKKMIGEGSDYTSIFNEMITNANFYKLYAEKEKGFELEVDLEKLVIKDAVNVANYVVPEGYLRTLSQNAVLKSKQYLESATITESQVHAVTGYYVVGKENLSEEDKATITSLEGQITPASGTYSYEVAEDKKINKIAQDQLTEQITADPTASSYTIDISSSQLDEMFKSARILGNITTFAASDFNNVYKVNYVVINRITTVLSKDSLNKTNLYLIISVDINGYSIDIGLQTELDEEYTTSHYGAIRFTMKNMFLGDTAVSQETKNSLMQLIQKSIETGSFDSNIQFTSSGDNVYITVDLSTIFTSKLITEAMFDTSFGITSTTSSSDGHLLFTANRK